MAFRRESKNQVVYDANGADTNGITWSLGGADADEFNINSGTGEVTLIEDPDFETQPVYNFTVTATDPAGHETEQAVTLNINDVDEAAPAALASSEPDTTIVIFDLVDGESSSHSGRTFQSGVDYEIYILVDSDSEAVSLAAGQQWSGVDNLDSGDRITLVGTGSSILGAGSGPVNTASMTGNIASWQTTGGGTGAVLQNAVFTRTVGTATSSVTLFGSAVATDLSVDFSITMPAGILTSQGLA